MKSAVIVALIGYLAVAYAHSWVACADYATETGEYWDATMCRGYPRSFSKYAGAGFGVDTGYNYQVAGDVACREPRTNPVSDAYTAQYPMARYNPGQRICLAWPSKNHVAATCTNPFIPDTSLKVYLSGVNPTADPTLTQFETNLVADLTDHANGQIDFKGFQHCPKFCENMDKSFCSRCFNLPSNLQPGQYTMLWYWVFNPGSAPYTSCMDVVIGGAPVNTTGSSATTASATTASATTASATTASATTATATTGTPGTTTGAPMTTTGAAATTTGTPGTTTGTPATTTGSTSGSGAFTIFDEALASGWTTSWSWQSAVNIVSGGAYTGSNSMKIVMQPWAGLQLAASTQGITWAGKYTNLNFYVKTDAATTQLQLYLNGAKKVAVPSNTGWTPYSLSLANDLMAPATIGNPSAIVFFNNGPNPVTLYLDTVTLS